MVMLRPRVGARSAKAIAPGLLVCAIAAAIAYSLPLLLLPGISPLIVGLLLGVGVANIGLDLRRLAAGFAIASRPLLRLGIVLLGLKVSVDAILSLGVATVVAIVLCTSITFLSTIGIGRLMGLPARRSLLIAAGTSICGASAVAAMDSTVKGEDEDVTAAVAAVSLLGLACIIAIPLLQGPIGLSDAQAGLWAGLSVHEVAQVVAAAAVPGAAALAVAVPVKLGRVLLLAPILAVTSMSLRRGAGERKDAKRPPIVPLFVVGFIAAVALTSLVALPAPVLTVADFVQVVVMSAAMFAIGASVRLARLFRTGGRFLALGAISTALILALGLAAVSIIDVL